MTQSDKDLLLKDLCARLPYGVIVNTSKGNSPAFSVCVGHSFSTCLTELMTDKIEFVKPYLRPMSSMTYEEMQEAREKFFDGSDHYDIDNIGEIYADTYQPYTTVYMLSFARLSGYIDWLNSHHFDYRGLIEKGLAIAVTNENNPYMYI